MQQISSATDSVYTEPAEVTKTERAHTHIVCSIIESKIRYIHLRMVRALDTLTYNKICRTRNNERTDGKRIYMQNAHIRTSIPHSVEFFLLLYNHFISFLLPMHSHCCDTGRCICVVPHFTCRSRTLTTAVNVHCQQKQQQRQQQWMQANRKNNGISDNKRRKETREHKYSLSARGINKKKAIWSDHTMRIYMFVYEWIDDHLLFIIFVPHHFFSATKIEKEKKGEMDCGDRTQSVFIVGLAQVTSSQALQIRSMSNYFKSTVHSILSPPMIDVSLGWSCAHIKTLNWYPISY